MADAIVPHFQNDAGVEKIHTGVKKFKCMGASPPFDHPHVFLDMGGDDQIICPYCSTVYLYDPALSPVETIPPNCLYEADKAA